MDRKIVERLIDLQKQTAEAYGEMKGLNQAKDILDDLNVTNTDPKLMKKSCGVTRDIGLKMIEMGQNLRRIADLIEPIIDDVLKGEVP